MTATRVYHRENALSDASAQPFLPEIHEWMHVENSAGNVDSEGMNGSVRRAVNSADCQQLRKLRALAIAAVS